MKTLKSTLLFIFLFFSYTGFAQTWTGGGDGTSFSDSHNWDTNTVPGFNSTIIFETGGEITVTNIPITFAQASPVDSLIVRNNTDVTFENSGNSAEFYVNNIIIEGGSAFRLSGSPEITIFSQDAEIYGTLDAGDIHIFRTFGIGMGGYNFINAATFITANNNGVSGSIQGNYSHNSQFYLVYNSNGIQNAGLTSSSDTQFGTITIDNNNLNLDKDIEVSNLILQNGNMNIQNNRLTITGDIVYTNGKLSGNTASSILEITGTGTGDEINLIFETNNTNNNLDSLVINRPNEIVNLQTYLNLKTLVLNDGKLRLRDILDMSAGNSSADNNNNSDNYIITEPDTYLKMSVQTGSLKTFPVGTENYYAQVSIDSYQNGNFSVSANDTIYSEGDFGNPFTEKNVNIRWKIEPQTTNTDFDLTLNWDINANGGAFELTDAYISNFDGEEWDVLAAGTGTVSAGIATLSRTSVNTSGFFGVFSGTNTRPTASDNNFLINKDSIYTFTKDDFLFSDTDGDEFVKIMITQIQDKGKLFLDENSNNIPDNNESFAQNDQIQVSDINDMLLKYMPNASESGIPYTNFKFKVSDGLQYSTGDYTMTVNVGNNNPPAASAEQVFRIPEHSPRGTVVGKIQASDPDGDNIFFYPQEGIVYSDAFKLNDDGTIAVDNSALLEYSLNPSFEYNIDVCDDGQPELCTPVHVIINLDRIISNLHPANFISPNGDGHNDRWLVKGIDTNINDTGIYEVSIFNSEGKLLFHSDNYKNNWDGTSRGRQLPPGVYYYLLTSPDTELKGTITLVR